MAVGGVVGRRQTIERLEPRHLVDEQRCLDAVTLHDERPVFAGRASGFESEEGADIHERQDGPPEVDDAEQMRRGERDHRELVEHDHLPRMTHLDGEASARQLDQTRPRLPGCRVRLGGPRGHRRSAARLT